MKALILAVALALTSVPAAAENLPVYENVQTYSPEELKMRVTECIGLVSGKLTEQQIVNTLKLDTVHKQSEFINECIMFVSGVGFGAKASESITQTSTQKIAKK